MTNIREKVNYCDIEKPASLRGSTDRRVGGPADGGRVALGSWSRDGDRDAVVSDVVLKVSSVLVHLRRETQHKLTTVGVVYNVDAFQVGRVHVGAP